MKINITRNIGFIFLAVYLILIGVMVLVPGFAIPSLLMGIVALIAGVLILLGI